MATMTEHLRLIAETIQAAAVGLPSEIRINTTQHGYLTGKPNGHFIKTVLSVPCKVDTGVTVDNPAYKMSGGSDQTVSVAADAGTLY